MYPVGALFLAPFIFLVYVVTTFIHYAYDERDTNAVQGLVS